MTASGEHVSASRSAPRAASASAPPSVLRELLHAAGIGTEGAKPWDMHVHDPRLYGRVLRDGSLGLGEAYMDGWWDCEAIDELFERTLRADIDKRMGHVARFRLATEALRHRLFNLQSRARAYQVGEKHYDAGNDVFEAMLDSRLVYSCAYWERAQTLEQAQTHKLELICRKLDLRRGQRLLDIGCGWGGLARFAAERHGVQVVGITVSKEQLVLAREHVQGLPVELRLQDWRALDERFDRIVSVGMFEHVGPKNYRAFFERAQAMLEPEGLMLLHTIGIDRTQTHTDPWIDRYIFPNGKLPSAYELTQALEGQLLIEDWHNFGADYDRTLMSWWHNFEAAWPRLRERYDQRFYRMWKYYLLSCAGFFRSRQGQLWQLVLTRSDRRAVYRSVR